MTTRTLTGTYASGYTIVAPTTILSIAATGLIEGSGLSTSPSASVLAIFNNGQIKTTGNLAGFGVDLTTAATVTNGSASNHTASILGGLYGVYDGSGGAGRVTNYGVIECQIGDFFAAAPAAIEFANGGVVTNGSAADTTALIEGANGDSGVMIQKAPGTLANFGTIESGGASFSYRPSAVQMTAGTVTNGGTSDTAATIEGDYAVFLNGGGTVVNFGKILGSYNETKYGVGVDATGTTQLTNGAANDTTAVISGLTAVYITGGVKAASTVTNFGDIEGTGLQAAYAAVHLINGGVVINGTPTDTAAKIRGGQGVWIQAQAGAVTNYGRITALSSDGLGVKLEAGGKVTNGAANDVTARILGHDGAVSIGGVGTIINFGTLASDLSSYAYAVQLNSGGTLTNGSATDTRALVQGYSGLSLSYSTATNFGTIDGVFGVGVAVGGYAALINGSASDSSALIEGVTGVTQAGVGRPSALTNFGTIEGTGGTALSMSGSEARLVLEAGCAFEGSVIGNGGALVLDSPGAVIALPSKGNVTVSGNMTPQTFSGFGQLYIDAKSTAAMSVAGTVANMGLVVDGSLSVASVLTLAAGSALIVSASPGSAGTIAGAGSLAITGSQAAFDAGTALAIAKISVAGPSSVTTIGPAASLTYAGVWSQSAGTLSVGAGATMAFTGTGDLFSGTLTGAGAISIAAGSDTLRGAMVNVTGGVSVASAATLTIQGAITLVSGLALTTAGTVRVAVAGATLSGAGELDIDASGVVTSNTLTNAGRINGAGAGAQLGAGHMTLINQAGGQVIANSSLTVDTGAATIVNAGRMTASGGPMLIKSAVNNTGLLWAANFSNLTVLGAVTGAGTVEIGGGAADFASTFNENVLFAGPGPLAPSGTLELAHSQAYTASISGFSTTGATKLDLDDIAFGSKTTAIFSGTSAGGTLTVTDGVHTSKIALVGNFTASTFVAATDGHGGTLVHDPAKTTTAHTGPDQPLAGQLVTAIAGFGATPSFAVDRRDDVAGESQAALARPRSHLQ